MLPSESVVEGAEPLKGGADPNRDREGEQSGGRTWRVLALASVLLLAFLLRAPFAGAGLPYLHHWNEPESASTALRMMTSGDLNPHFFNYGTLPIYLNLGVDVLNYFRLMGKPADAESHLSSLNEIEFSLDGKKRWMVSHPSFYHWNRLVSVLFGVATVLSVYFLGSALAGPVQGHLAALWLAVVPFHIMHSARITPDDAVTFLTLNVVLCSVLFVKRERLSDLAMAFVFAGLACATKYNVATMMVLPLALLAWSAFGKRPRTSPWQSALLLLLPGVVFLLAMPYALLDLPAFLSGAGAEVRHYRVDGHGPLTIEPGWQQIRFQAAELWRKAGPGCLLALAGLAPIWKRKAVLWALVAPAAYFLFMIQMRVDSHRNFLVLYPYFAILLGFGIVFLHRLCQDGDGGRWRSRWLMRWPMRWLAVALAVVALALPAWQSISAAVTLSRQIETRSEAVLKINRAKVDGFERAVVAVELGVHPLDLKKLELPYELVSTTKFRSLMPRAPRTLFVMPESVDFAESYSTKGRVQLAAALDRLKRELPEERIVERIGGEADRSVHRTGEPVFQLSGVTRLDFYSVNPVILLVSGGGDPARPDAPSS
ncbi:MAG: glycosyltransferase family 39 protein [bacterium]|nr:glycosyltransferase family 39 protein [bacterium]